MTEVRMNLEKKLWADLNNVEVMGTAPARKAHSMEMFLSNLKYIGGMLGEYSCTEFDSYVEGMVRAYQINENDYDDVHISTTINLHYIKMTGEGLDNFLEYMKDEWSEYIEWARENGI